MKTDTIRKWSRPMWKFNRHAALREYYKMCQLALHCHLRPPVPQVVLAVIASYEARNAPYFKQSYWWFNRFHPPGFHSAIFSCLFLRVEWSNLNQIRGQHRSIIGAPKECFRLPTYCFVLKRERVKCDWGRKSRPNFGFLIPVKLGEGWAKCLNEFFTFNVRPNLWYIFGTASLCVLGGCWSNG